MKNILYIICLAIVLSCENKENYKPAEAIVIKTHKRHIGHGAYKLVVFYKFKVGTDTIITQSTSKGLENVMTAKYVEGDSILVGYNPIDHSESFISKKIYAKPRKRNK